MALKPNTWDARLLASHYGGRLGGGCPAEAPQPGVSSLGSDGQCINPARHAGQKQGERSSPRQTAGAPANTVCRQSWSNGVSLPRDTASSRDYCAPCSTVRPATRRHFLMRKVCPRKLLEDAPTPPK